MTVHTRGATLAGFVLFFALAVSGCYTRLTTPKEAFNYTATDGTPIQSIAVKAPVYNEIIRQQTAANPDVATYRLSPGTRVRVEVWGHGINSTLNIRPDGVIDLPLVGDIHAAGKTIAELKREVSEKYATFYQQAPQIILNTEVSDQQETVRGGDVSVFNPSGGSGVVNLTGDEYLSQVIAQVSGLGEKSEWNEIAIIRRGLATGERFIILCDFELLFRDGDMDQDILMRNGDIVYVPVEKNTLLQEILASFDVFAGFINDIDVITQYVEKVEGY